MPPRGDHNLRMILAALSSEATSRFADASTNPFLARIVLTDCRFRSQLPGSSLRCIAATDHNTTDASGCCDLSYICIAER